MSDVPASLRWARIVFAAGRAVSAAALFVFVLLQSDLRPAITLGRVVDQVLVTLPLVAVFVLSDAGYRRARSQIRDWRNYTRQF
jgi:hypothetical protein